MGCSVAVVIPWWLNLWRVVEGVVLNRGAAAIFFYFGLVHYFTSGFFMGVYFVNSFIIGAVFA